MVISYSNIKVFMNITSTTNFFSLFYLVDDFLINRMFIFLFLINFILQNSNKMEIVV